MLVLHELLVNTTRFEPAGTARARHHGTNPRAQYPRNLFKRAEPFSRLLQPSIEQVPHTPSQASDMMLEILETLNYANFAKADL
jgi:hypothetical protein